MERAEWLLQMRAGAEWFYDQFAPKYWVTFGLYPNETHLAYLQKLLGWVAPAGTLLSAGCGAGRYDGLLLAAGHHVLGIDPSAGMLARARERFPTARYERMGLQDMDWKAKFDGAICIDALEHVSPEDWPGIVQRLRAALKPGGVLYFTVDPGDPLENAESYARARSMGLPVVFGEVADRVEETLAQIQASGPSALAHELADGAVYHYHPSLEQVRKWLVQAGLSIEEQGTGNGYEHFLARKVT